MSAETEKVLRLEDRSVSLFESRFLRTVAVSPASSWLDVGSEDLLNNLCGKYSSFFLMSGSCADFYIFITLPLSLATVKLCRCEEEQTLHLSVDHEARFHYQRPGKWKLAT